MQALVFKDVGRIELENIPVPKISKPDQVIVKIAACGICGSDIKILEGKHAYKKDIVLGHEFNGVVVDVGSAVQSVKVGDRIALDNNPRCGLCDFCRVGLSSQCTELKNVTLGVFQHGGYAEYCIAPEQVCFKIPDALDDILATQVETLGTVLNGMNTVQIQCYDNVVILGFGPIGYLFAGLARNMGANVIVTEIDPFRLNIAKEMGYNVFNPNEIGYDQVGKEIAAMTHGKMADVVIDAVGSQLENAISYITPGGKVLMFGMDDSYHPTITPYQITRRAIKLLGTYIGQNTMLQSIRIFEANKIDMKPFFTETVPLTDGAGAFTKLGLDLDTFKNGPKQAMKLVFKP